MLWLKIIGKFLKVLKEGATPAQIALGFALGWAIGLIPGWPAQAWVLMLVLLVLRANLSMALAGVALAAGLGWLLDPLLDGLGGAILTTDALRGVFTALYNSPPWGLTRFNNTVVMGGTVASAASAILLFPLLIRAVHWYRERLLQRIARLKVVQMLMGTRIVAFYQRLEQMGLV